MPKSPWVILFALLLLPSSIYAYNLMDTQDFSLGLESYLRTDLVTFKNVTGLDSSNKDDRTLYLGLDYSLAFKADFKQADTKLYIKFERNGPYDYSAPIFIHNTLINSGGRIERYRNDELLPQLEECWLDTKLLDALRLKAGIYIYEVANGFSLNGNYENYGLAIYHESRNFLWRLYYCRPDLIYKNHLGPKIPQEIEQGMKYEHNAANFFATDARIKAGNQVFWPYVGVLADYTSNGKRDNLFSAPIKRDILGTLGTAWSLETGDFSLKLEAARNFGEAKSESPEYKSVRHSGYLIYAGLDYYLDKLTPSLQFLLCSGNKTSPEMAENGDQTYSGSRNRAFSYYSPSNMNLGDTISSSNVDMLPIVAMGGGYGLNYGVLRPGVFAAGDFEDLIMPSFGFDYAFTEKLDLGFYFYYLRAFAKPVGTLDGKGRYLSQELGYEADLYIDYSVNKNMTLSLLAGYFIPGRYYKERRDDTSGSIFSPYLRGDGSADCAYQIELCMELKF